MTPDEIAALERDLPAIAERAGRDAALDLRGAGVTDRRRLLAYAEHLRAELAVHRGDNAEASLIRAAERAGLTRHRGRDGDPDWTEPQTWIERYAIDHLGEVYGPRAVAIMQGGKVHRSIIGQTVGFLAGRLAARDAELAAERAATAKAGEVIAERFMWYEDRLRDERDARQRAEAAARRWKALARNYRAELADAGCGEWVNHSEKCVLWYGHDGPCKPDC